MSDANGQSWRNWAFGEVLPRDALDDRPDPEHTDPDERDRWILDNRPPHYDTAW